MSRPLLCWYCGSPTILTDRSEIEGAVNETIVCQQCGVIGIKSSNVETPTAKRVTR